MLRMFPKKMRKLFQKNKIIFIYLNGKWKQKKAS